MCAFMEPVDVKPSVPLRYLIQLPCGAVLNGCVWLFCHPETDTREAVHHIVPKNSSMELAVI